MDLAFAAIILAWWAWVIVQAVAAGLGIIPPRPGRSLDHLIAEHGLANVTARLAVQCAALALALVQARAVL